MALPIPPNNPNTPIPNNPFYSPEETFFCGAYYPAIVTPTSGLTVNSNGTITVTGGGGGGGVTALAAGPGIALSSTTGSVTVCTNLAAGANIVLTPTGNQIAISATGLGTGTVTAIAVGPGLNATSNPITTSGSISLNNACVIPPSAFAIKGNLLVGTGAGSYTALNPGTDGQVLFACNGSGAAGLCWGSAGTVTSVTGVSPISVATGTTTPDISIAAASLTGPGAVQLSNVLNSTSTTQALTAAQGKALQDQINSLLVSGTIELAGTINASTGKVVDVTSVGATALYTSGNDLPAASLTTNNTYVIVTTPGTMTPPGGSPTVATRGDWFLVSELTPGNYSWTFLNVGFDAPAASDTVPGIVELATNAETITGTDATIAVTPAGAAAAYIAKSALTAKGALLSATAPGTPSALAVGLDNCILVACNAAPTGLCWASPPASGIPCGCITAKGTLISGTAASTPTALPVGNDDYVLTACNAASTGLCWAPLPASGIPCACVLGKGALITGTAGSTPAGLPVGLDCQVLMACSTCACGLTWAALPSTSSATPTALGTVFARTEDLSLNLNTGLGQYALTAITTGYGNTALGWASGCALTTGSANTFVGENIFVTGTSSTGNTAVGDAAGNTATGNNNVFLGLQSGYRTTGNCNTFVGYNSVCTAGVTGAQNVAIGYGVCLPTTAGSCQLVLGFSAGQNWLTGDSGKHIRPGAGIRDCAGNLGTAGQVLCSTGGAIQWASVTTTDWISAGTIQSVGLTTTGGIAPVAPAVVIRNEVTYRQVGGKIWQVAYMFAASTAFTNAGNGDWLFTLPNGLQFNTSLSSQPLFTGSVNANNHANRQYFIPGASSIQVAFNDGSNGAQFGSGVIVYSATQFRIFTTDVGNGAPGAVRSNYWGNGVGGLDLSVGFQLATP